MTAPARANPYVGPRAFRTGEVLYGRDREVLELLDLLIAERIVLLFAPSGAGKTSLIQAALMPRLQQEGFEVLPPVRVGMEPVATGVMTAGNRYVQSALLSLEEGRAAEQRLPLSRLAEMELAAYLDQRNGDSGHPESEVLIVDQFEELIVLDPTDVEAKVAFFTQLGAALKDRRRWALISVREDFLATLDPFARLIPTRLSTTMRLDLLGDEAARLAMQEPAHRAGVEFTDGAARRLSDDLRRVWAQKPDGTVEERLGAYVEPVQLQVVCYRLWEHLAPSTTRIEERSVGAVGDVNEALAGYYAERMEATAHRTGMAERSIREWFDHALITERGIRGQVLQEPERSQGLDNPIIRQLIDAHLVRGEQRHGATWFELAHDRLIAPVRDDNARWFADHLSPFQRQALLWQAQGRPDSLLVRGRDLVEAERWVAGQQGDLTETERQFLDACQKARAAVRRERRARILVWVAIGATLIVASLTVLLVVTFRSRQQANMARQQAETRESLAIILSNPYLDPTDRIITSEALLSQATSSTRTSAADAVQSALHEAVVPHVGRGHSDRINQIAFSPNGQELATASQDATVRIWESSSGKELFSLQNPAGQTFSSVAFQPGGTLLAAGDRTGIVHLWDVRAGEAAPQELTARSIPEPPSQILSLAFNHSGSKLAVGTSDGRLVVWDIASNHDPSALDTDLQYVWSIAFNPTRDELVAAGAARNDPNTGALDLFNTDDRTKLWSTSQVSTVLSVSFSPDGHSIAIGRTDGGVNIINTADHQTAQKLAAHLNSVFSVAFNPDGTLLATGGADSVAKIWSVAGGRELTALRDHSDVVSSVAFNPVGGQMATASWDKTARIGDVPVQHFDQISGLAFGGDPARPILATASTDGTAKVWTVDADQLRLTRDGSWQGSHGGPVIYGVAMSPDGKRLATAGADGTVRLWNIGDPNPTATLNGYTGPVYAVAFNPNRPLLASAGADGKVRLWDLADPNESSRVLRNANGRPVICVAFSPDGDMLVTGDELGVVTIFDMTKASPTRIGDFVDPQVLSDVYYPDVTRTHNGRVVAVAFSRDGSRLATGGADAAVKLWDVRTRKEIGGPFVHQQSVNSVAFSPDGTKLASGSDDATVDLWNIESKAKKPLRSFHFSVTVTQVVFSEDGTYLAVGDGNGRIYLDPLDISKLQQLAKSRG